MFARAYIIYKYMYSRIRISPELLYQFDEYLLNFVFHLSEQTTKTGGTKSLYDKNKNTFFIPE